MSKTGKIIIILVMVLIILALGAAGALLYFQGKYLPYFDKIVTVPFFEQSPETVVRVMQKNMAGLNTAHYELESEITWLSYNSPLAVKSHIIFDGGLDKAVIGQLVLKNDIQIQDLNFLANFEMLLMQEKSFFRISEVPAIPFMDLDKVKNKWYKYVPSASSDDWGKTLIRMKEVLSNSKLVKVIERLPDEQINGQLTYRYIVEPDTDNIKNLIALMPDEIKNEHKLNISRLSGQKFEIWVSKKNNYLYRLTGTYEDKKIIADFTMNTSRFNQTVSIKEPSDSDSMIDFSKKLFNQTNFLDIPIFGYLVGLDTQEFVEDTDEDGLYTIWENMFGTDPNKSDTDGDGYKDGDEVRNGYNPKGEGRLFQ
jgi:hypothetical protein